VPALLALAFSIVIVSVGTSSFVHVITQTSSTATVYLDLPTINGTAINQTFTVNINISNAINITDWGIGLTFNPTFLTCTGFFQGEFLSDVGTTLWTAGTIDNTAGVVTVHGCNFLGPAYRASGSGRLAYATFRVKAPGISDIHLRDVKVMTRVYDPVLGYWVPVMVSFNIIDVYTVVVDTTPHTVVTVSNSTGKTGMYSSGFYGHAFSILDKEISFNVTGPSLAFSNVTVPKALLEVEDLDEWKVIIDGIPVSRTVTYNGSHYSIYFTYTLGIHKVQITSKRDLAVSLEAPTVLLFDESTLLTATVYNLGVNDEANVTLQLLINGLEVNSTLISLLLVGQNSTLSYLWTPPAVEATYNVTAYTQLVTDETVIDNNIATKFVTVRSLTIDPESGPIGTKVTVDGVKFGNQTQVSVTFNDMLIGYVMTDENGTFTFVFNIPVSAAGIHTVKALDAEGHYGVATFTVIDVTPLDIKIDVGTIHFRGELAEFYIQTTFKGTTVNATSISALLYKPDGTTEVLTVPPLVATDFYKITYAILGDALNGTYALVIEAIYTTSTIETHGTSFKTFLLSPTLTAINATLVSLNGTVALVQTEIGTIETDIANIGLKVSEIDGDIATIHTTLGTIEGRIVSINGSMATIQTDIGTVQVDISSIKGVQEAFTTPLYIAVILALIAAVGAIVIIFLRRKPYPK